MAARLKQAPSVVTCVGFLCNKTVVFAIFTLQVSRKMSSVTATVRDLERLRPAEMSAQHNQCPAMGCNEGSMRSGTQRERECVRVCVIV